MNHRVGHLRRRLVPMLILGQLTISPVRLHAQGQPGWTLERCEREAFKTSHDLRASVFRVEGSEATAREARAVRWPALAVEGSYTRVSETMSLDLPPFGVFDPPEIEFGDGKTYDFHVALNAPLFTGGALRSRARAEEAALRAARCDLASDSLSLVHEVRRAYFAALGAEAEARVARVVESRLRRHLEELDAAVAVGALSEEARIQSLAHFREAQQERIGAEARAKAERLALGRWVGHPGEEVRPSRDLDEPLLDSNGPWDGAIDARPDLSALAERIRQSEALVSAARAAFLPTVSAQLSYHHARPGIDPVANEWMQYGSGGIVLSWSLWEWGARSHRIRQARAAGRALEEQHSQLRDVLRTRLEVARVGLASAMERMEKATDRVELERRRLDLVKGRYRAAAASESERLDAEDDLAAAEIGLAAAVVRLRLAEAELLYVLGR